MKTLELAVPRDRIAANGRPMMVSKPSNCRQSKRLAGQGTRNPSSRSSPPQLQRRRRARVSRGLYLGTLILHCQHAYIDCRAPVLHQNMLRST
ncbi:hypothetical protein CC77DRAFT_1051 [Alternaria alternata]|uniref:Uncharacterized protein n=1 Tax=Alternaria alternata TaxID=5599 RepID=A0A177E1R4_ALTAL|nr:hypothetical protein CC77DRAFT_1051 [Alternaria alternata]OAG25668.1 hypothetical protein CC77DRAFT_1051 [Alternaria alternata]